MELILLIVYSVIVWLIFFKFKLLPWNITSQVIVVTIPIIALTVLAHLPVGIITAAMVLAFRTRGPLPQIVMLASSFLGGVYYPTTVIPGWIKSISAFLPLTYGLTSLRAVLLEGQSITSVWRELLILGGFTIVAFVVSVAAFNAALRYARRIGNLAQY